MHRLNRKVLMILTGLSFVLFSGGMTRLHCETVGSPSSSEASRLPIIMAHQGSAPSLERPPVAFDQSVMPGAVDRIVWRCWRIVFFVTTGQRPKSPTVAMRSARSPSSSQVSR